MYYFLVVFAVIVSSVTSNPTEYRKNGFLDVIQGLKNKTPSDGKCISKCPWFQVFDFLPHDDCNKYCVCVSRFRFVVECEDGTYFSAKHNLCVDPSESECGKVEGCLGQCPHESINSNALLAHRDCNKFCRCKKGRAVVDDCAPNYQFNEEKQQCLFRSEAGCDRENGYTTTSKPSERETTSAPDSTESSSTTAEPSTTTSSTTTAAPTTSTTSTTSSPTSPSRTPSTSQPATSSPSSTVTPSTSIASNPTSTSTAVEPATSSSSASNPTTSSPSSSSSTNPSTTSPSFSESNSLLTSENPTSSSALSSGGNPDVPFVPTRNPPTSSESDSLPTSSDTSVPESLTSSQFVAAKSLSKLSAIRAPLNHSASNCAGHCPSDDDPDAVVLLANKDCTKYCRCRNGHPVVKNCPPNYDFSLDHEMCLPSKGNCHSNST